MQVQDCLDLLRDLIDDTQTIPADNGRWSDATLMKYLDRANKKVVRKVRFPDSRIVWQTVAGQQLYQIPTVILEPRAVYLGGQLLVPTTLDVLEGRQIQLYDQRGQGTQSAGSDGPVGNLGVGVPVWSIMPPLTAPFNGRWTYPAPDAQPQGASQQYRYYRRGGYLGITPAPAQSGVYLEFDALRLPDTLTTNAQVMTVPDNFMEALCWRAAVMTAFSSKTQMSEAELQDAKNEYQEAIVELMTWRDTQEDVGADMPKVMTYRRFYVPDSWGGGEDFYE